MSQPRNIGINTLFLIPNEVGGTEYYSRSFLAELEKQDHENTYAVFCNHESFESFVFTNPLWKKVLCPVSARNRIGRILFEQCALPFLVWREKCSLLHSFGYVAPFLLTVPSLVTVHDVNWKDHPEDSSFLANRVMSFLMSLTLASSKIILTDSEFSRTRLYHHLPLYRSKVRVLEPGLDEQFLSLLKKEQKLPSGVKKPFLLCVSGLYPHKKVSYLFELWNELRKTNSEYELVIVGKNGAEADKVRTLAASTAGVRLLEKVSLPELVGLYQHAELSLQPSVYEGFGYPVYEALAAGLPVMVGKKECYSKEVQGNLQLFTFDPVQDAELVRTLVRSQTPVNLPNYKEAAKKLLALYKESL